MQSADWYFCASLFQKIRANSFGWNEHKDLDHHCTKNFLHLTQFQNQFALIFALSIEKSKEELKEWAYTVS